MRKPTIENLCFANLRRGTRPPRPAWLYIMKKFFYRIINLSVSVFAIFYYFDLTSCYARSWAQRLKQVFIAKLLTTLFKLYEKGVTVNDTEKYTDNIE